MYLTYGKQIFVHVTEWKLYKLYFTVSYKLSVLISDTLELIRKRARQQMFTDCGIFFKAVIAS